MKQVRPRLPLANFAFPVSWGNFHCKLPVPKSESKKNGKDMGVSQIQQVINEVLILPALSVLDKQFQDTGVISVF